MKYVWKTLRAIFGLAILLILFAATIVFGTVGLVLLLATLLVFGIGGVLVFTFFVWASIVIDFPKYYKEMTRKGEELVESTDVEAAVQVDIEAGKK
jgi:uncharacterized protein (DUF58 family)